MNQSIEATLKQEPSKKVQYLILTTIIVAAFVWSLSAIEFNAVDDGGWKIASKIIQGILTPDMELLWNFTNQGVFYLLFETICTVFPCINILAIIFNIVCVFPVPGGPCITLI